MKNWEYKINIKQFLSRDDFEKTKSGLFEYLRTDKVASKIIPSDFAIRFNETENEDEFDDVLEELYNYADENNIWLGN